MSKFNILVEQLLTEFAANVAGGAGSAFGPAATGDGGGRFGVQDDKAYAPGDVRIPAVLGIKSKKRKKKRIPFARRNQIKMY